MNSKMKKLLAICLTIVMLMSFSVIAFAAPDNFVSSPSGQSAPEIIDFSVESEDCYAGLEITPYSERDDLPEEIREQFEKAYEQIVSATDLTALNADLAKVAKDLGIPAENLAVSELFDVRYINCAEHEGHGYFDIVLKPETLKGFVGLLHLNGESWELIKNAKVEENGKHLVFSVDDFSPFAIVVNTEEKGASAPSTGEIVNIAIYAVIMIVSAVALVFVCVKFRKKNA